MPYSEVSITGYNSNPPEDDGTQASSNEVSWSKHKTKIGDPLKTAIESTQTNITTAIDAIEADLIEAGTAMLFMQTAAPTGWTKDTTANLNDTSLRLVTGTVSSRTTQSAFSTVFAKTVTDAHTLTTGQIPAHIHGSGTLTTTTESANISANRRSLGDTSGTADNARISLANTSGTTGTFSGFTGNHNHSIAGSTGSVGSDNGHTHNMDIRVNYHDCIKATKD